jgi:hypothetical protein
MLTIMESASAQELNPKIRYVLDSAKMTNAWILI